MARRLQTDIPGRDWRVDIDEVRERGWPAVFAPEIEKPLPLVVEIGFGRGEFVLDLAPRHPETAFVGVEVSAKRVLKMARRLARTDVENVRLVGARAERVLIDVLADESVACFWINFPDPWPKTRHQRRRFVQSATAELMARCLVPGGRLRLATDHLGYAEWVADVLEVTPLLRNAYAPDRWRSQVAGRKATAYELEWRSLGRDFHFFEYERVALPLPDRRAKLRRDVERAADQGSLDRGAPRAPRGRGDPPVSG